MSELLTWIAGRAGTPGPERPARPSAGGGVPHAETGAEPRRDGAEAPESSLFAALLAVPGPPAEAAPLATATTPSPAKTTGDTAAGRAGGPAPAPPAANLHEAVAAGLLLGPVLTKAASELGSVEEGAPANQTSRPAPAPKAPSPRAGLLGRTGAASAAAKAAAPESARPDQPAATAATVPPVAEPADGRNLAAAEIRLDKAQVEIAADSDGESQATATPGTPRPPLAAAAPDDAAAAKTSEAASKPDALPAAGAAPEAGAAATHARAGASEASGATPHAAAARHSDQATEASFQGPRAPTAAHADGTAGIRIAPHNAVGPPADIRAQVFGQVLDRDLGASSQRIRLDLDPPRLGRVEVQIHVEGQHLKIVFTAETRDVEAVLHDSADELVEALMQRGGRWSEVEIRCERQPAEARERGQSESRFRQDREQAGADRDGRRQRDRRDEEAKR